MSSGSANREEQHYASRTPEWDRRSECDELFCQPKGKNAGPMTTDPIHLFDPRLKGIAGKPTQPVRLSPTTQIDVFLNALLETGTTRTVRTSPLKWVVATGIYITHVVDNIERNKSNLQM
jgi:hypothetical protein